MVRQRYEDEKDVQQEGVIKERDGKVLTNKESVGQDGKSTSENP